MPSKSYIELTLFSNQPIKSIDNLHDSKVKMLVRAGDAVSEYFYKTVKFVGVPLSVPQILPSLYAGQVNALIASPLSCAALQWYPKLKYMTDLPLSIGVSATVITKEKYDQLTPQAQQILRETAQKYHYNLVHSIREINERSIEALKKAGIQIVTVSDADREQWDERCVQMIGKLAGQVYSEERLEQVNTLLEEYR